MAFDLGELLKDVPDLGTGREQIEYIKLDLIDEDPNNFYQLSAIDELAANIELCGLQQPIRVRKQDDGRYMIVSGHRRRAAVAMLAQENPDKWSEVPCIIETDEVSPALQQLRLILANANTRKMTDAEIAEEAAQVKAILYRMKEEEGFEFPGRIRDRVAEIVKISKSKLSRLEAIENHLASVWGPTWKNGTLSENTAYELSRMARYLQNLLFEEKQRTNANLKYLYADDVRKFAERAAAIESLRCGDADEACINCEGKLRKAAVADRYGWFYCDSKCCKDCPELLRCKAACPKLKDFILESKAINKKKAAQEAAALALKDKPKTDKISEIWQRFGILRAAAGADFDDCKKALGAHCFPHTVENAIKLEAGQYKITTETYLPFGYGYGLGTINGLIGLADLFNCSLDYLLCRTEEKCLLADSTKPGTIWHPISEEPPTGVDLVWLDANGYSDTGVYYGSGNIESICTIQWPEARWWAELPKED